MNRPKKIPTILGLTFTVFGLVAGVILVRYQLIGNTRASSEEAPTNVRIGNVSDTSFTVAWTTDRKVTGFVRYGKRGESIDLVVSDERDQARGSIEPYNTHFVVVRGLEANTNYEFEIGSGNGIYKNESSERYLVKTHQVVGAQPKADVAYGKVVYPGGDPAEGVLVYMNIQGAGPLIDITKTTGSFVLPLSSLRNELGEWFGPIADNFEYTIEILTGSDAAQKIALNSQNDSPSEDIVLGISKNISAKASDSTSSIESKFGEDALKITSPDVGGLVFQDEVEVSGVGPAGAEINIEIHSDTKITGLVKADSNGEFLFSVPSGLEPGQHTITVWTTINGVVKKATRVFTVYAAENESNLPVKTATPSASTTTPAITPTITITKTLQSPTPRATIVPSPTTTKAPITPTPTRVPRVVQPSTSSALAETGESSLTFFIILVGLGLAVGGGLLLKTT